GTGGVPRVGGQPGPVVCPLPWRFSLTAAAFHLTNMAAALPCQPSRKENAVPVRWLCTVPAVLVAAALLCAQAPDKVAPVPPPGIEIGPEGRTELQREVDELGKEIAALDKALAAKPALHALLPDVQIFHNAVRYALTYNEFYSKTELPAARALLKQGQERAG